MKGEIGEVGDTRKANSNMKLMRTVECEEGGLIAERGRIPSSECLTFP